MQTLDLKKYIFLVDFSDHHMSVFTELIQLTFIEWIHFHRFLGELSL